jgi:hypothetical protein
MVIPVVVCAAPLPLPGGQTQQQMNLRMVRLADLNRPRVRVGGVDVVVVNQALAGACRSAKQ